MLSPNATLKQGLKRSLDVGYAGYVAAGRLFGAFDYPVPPFTAMHKTSSRTIRHFYESGSRCVLPIVTMAKHYGFDFERGAVLDFGCGVGRQLVHLTQRFPKCAYAACDVDQRAVGFVSEHYPQVDAYVNGFSPPLRYSDGGFDLVYSVSIFSHLDVADIPAWLNELARVTKPGGLLCLTTEGRCALPLLARPLGATEAELSRRLEEDGVIFKQYEYATDASAHENSAERSTLLAGIEGNYGNTVLSRAHIQQHWGTEQLEVLDVVEGVVDFRQDLVVLRRTQAAC